MIFSTGNRDIVVDLKDDIKELVKGVKFIDKYNHFERDKLTLKKENDLIKYKILFSGFHYIQEGDSVTDIRNPYFRIYFRIKE